MAVTMEGEVKAVQVRVSLKLKRLLIFTLVTDTPHLPRLTNKYHPPTDNALQKDAEAKMKKSVDAAENNLKAIRTGRAS